jgi:hypothetical protein
MGKNDIVLIDSIVEKTRSLFSSELDDPEYFEIFCFDQILKDFDLSYEELLSGNVGGGNDGGIDGFFTFLNGNLLTETADEDNFNRNPIFSIHILTVKHGDTFKQIPINNLLSTLPEILDFQIPIGKLKATYNDSLINNIDIFRNSYINLATKHPNINITITYVCRGDTEVIPPNINSRVGQLKKIVKSMFSNANVNIDLIGASELLSLARRRRIYSLRLRFIENYVSRDSSNYVLLSRLDDYYKFVTDEGGYLRRYLFDSNVRDFLGSVSVNKAISNTLESNIGSRELDFWWLNNGITILSSNATIAGKELSLENVQIVNGLQTTESIYHFLSADPQINDDRAVLIKVIVAGSEEIRDQIIRATNNQSPIEIASLRATDKIQRDIEHLLDDHGWFYDRRKNFHKNQGRPADKIISMSYLGAAVQAIALCNPAKAKEQKTKYMRNDEKYYTVFNDKWDIYVFLVSLELVKFFDLKLRHVRQHGRNYYFFGNLKHLKFIAALIFVCQKLKSINFNPNEIVNLVGKFPDDNEIDNILFIISEACRIWGENSLKMKKQLVVTKIAGSSSFQTFLFRDDFIRQFI